MIKKFLRLFKEYRELEEVAFRNFKAKGAWRDKYYEMVVANEELHTKLSRKGRAGRKKKQQEEVSL